MQEGTRVGQRAAAWSTHKKKTPTELVGAFRLWKIYRVFLSGYASAASSIPMGS